MLKAKVKIRVFPVTLIVLLALSISALLILKSTLGGAGECVNTSVEAGSNAISLCTSALKKKLLTDRARVKVLVHRADAFLNEGQYQNAIHDYTEAANLAPASAYIYQYRGSAHSHALEFEQAIEDDIRAINLEPTNYQLQSYLCLDLAMNDRAAEALPHCSSAVNAEPHDSDFRLKRAYTYMRLNNWQAAADDLLTDLQFEQDRSADALFMYAYVAEKMGNADLAKINYEKARRAEPTIDAKMQTFGVVQGSPEVSPSSGH